MAYQVIARKWRPQTFEEVTGQEPITRTLRNAIEHERLHHSYLFSGARGVGKTTTARLLAKALNCHKASSPTVLPCRTDDPDACPSCREVSESRSIDVLEIDAASNTGVDNVRDAIIGSVGIAPARDRYKVFVIDEVHMLSANAFNALLKTIEEPPPRVVFIMATTERHKVPETILSRSQQFDFRTIPTVKIFERLRLIADAENIKVPDEALREIARSGEGSMRDAQSAFDQVISFSGPEIKQEDVELALGVAGADILIRVVNGIAAHNPAEALSVIDDVVMRGQDLRNFCRDLLAHLRDLLVTKVSGSDELLDAAICTREELERQAALFTESDLVRFFHSLADTETKLREASHPRYQVEIGLVKLMEMRRLEPVRQLLERVAALEESLRTGQPSTAAPSSSTPSEGGTKGLPPRSSAAGTSGATAVSQSFTATGTAPAFEPGQAAESAFSPTAVTTPTVAPEDLSEIDRIKSALEAKRKRLLVTALESANVAMVENDELFVEFTPETRHLRDTLAKSENVKILREACHEVRGRDTGVRIVIKDQAGAADDDAPRSKEEEQRLEKQALRAAAEKNPLVQQMLKTFRGEIADVRRVEREK